MAFRPRCLALRRLPLLCFPVLLYLLGDLLAVTLRSWVFPEDLLNVLLYFGTGILELLIHSSRHAATSSASPTVASRASRCLTAYAIPRATGSRVRGAAPAGSRGKRGLWGKLPANQQREEQRRGNEEAIQSRIH